MSQKDEVDTSKIFTLAKRRGILWRSNEIYGGSAGFFDLGPLGSQILNNITTLWRNKYVVAEGFFEIETPNIVPYEVFDASGHVGEFTDVITRCTKCGASFRADHLLVDLHPNPDALDTEELEALIQEHSVQCPTCGGSLGKCTTFNLMFQTNVGPGEGKPAFLRPETAQAMFTDFPLLYRHARERLPLGVVQIGKGFRNEISPRQGLIRLREFHMAELELFIHPAETSHPRFCDISALEVPLLSNTKEPQEGHGEMVSLRASVEDGIIAHEMLAYHVGLVYQYLVSVGLDPQRIRFRQHLKTEMAHYARDCWDAEALTSFGWVELVGVADRSCYDLEQHMKHSGADMQAQRKYETPREVTRLKAIPDLKKMGPLFGKKTPAVAAALDELGLEEVQGLRDGGTLKMNIQGEDLTIGSDMVKVEEVTEKETGEKFTPHVIEPSFGLDRILYSILEHSYREETEGDETYRVLGLKPKVAPIKVGVFPLMAKDGLDIMAQDIELALRKAGLISTYDASGSIGRRYARMDEVGTPFCVTVDYDSKDRGDVTIRERDSKKQVREKQEHLLETLSGMIDGRLSFSDLLSTLEVVEGK